ncbi:MAG: hypothetical protein E7158_04860 [Firmicutes bacterium]|nr:hypothetical protein [Bacillota bacterium]
MSKRKELITDIIWLFIIGGLLGYAIEVLYYFIKNGVWINKQGLLYGPFKPIYGLGTMLITFVFKKIKSKNFFIIFILGTVLGSAYEYLLSVFQEYVLHTSTWNYSSFNYNLNGRIYLPYCFCWGIVSLIWIKLCYPPIKKIINKIPYTITLITGILIILDVLISGIAVYEYSNRQNNIKSNNTILKIIDKKYPDEIIEKKYPKLRVVKNK